MDVQAELFRGIEDLDRQDLPIGDHDEIVGFKGGDTLKELPISSDLHRLEDGDAFFRREGFHRCRGQVLGSPCRLIRRCHGETYLEMRGTPEVLKYPFRKLRISEESEAYH